MDDFSKYTAMALAGVEPAQVYRVAKADGRDFAACIRLLRLVFQLSLTEAKAIMVLVDEQVTLAEYQERFMPALAFALKGEADESATQPGTQPLRTEAEYRAALAEMERMFEAELGTPEGERLDVLTALVEAYEEEHYPIPLPEPIAAILYHIESRGLSQADLEPYIGSAAAVSAVLERELPLSLEMIRKLHAGLGIPADILIQPYALAGQDAVA